MSLEPPAYIVSLQTNIRARPISWEGAVRARTISEDDLKKIKSVDKVRKEQRAQTVEANIKDYLNLFFGGDGNQSIFQLCAKRQDITQYLLVLLGDILEVTAFKDAAVRHNQFFQPFVPLLSHSSNPEEPINLLASFVLTLLISHALRSLVKPSDEVFGALGELFDHTSALARNSDSGLQDIAILEESDLLCSAKARELFWSRQQKTVEPLVEILRAAAGGDKVNGATAVGSSSSVHSARTEAGLASGVSLQSTYHCLLVLWQLSFAGGEIAQGLSDNYDIIILFTHLLRISPKEKLSRLLIGTLLNILSSSKDELLPVANQARLTHILNNIKRVGNTDEEMKNDIDELKTMLEDYAKSQSTFDAYSAEVKNGHLRWSGPHRDGAFWKAEARRIVDAGNGELLKELAEILSKSWEQDRQVLAIACNDVANIIKEVPEKRPQLEKAGLKSRVMALMESPDDNVKFEALRAVSAFVRGSLD